MHVCKDHEHILFAFVSAVWSARTQIPLTGVPSIADDAITSSIWEALDFPSIYGGGYMHASMRGGTIFSGGGQI